MHNLRILLHPHVCGYTLMSIIPTEYVGMFVITYITKFQVPGSSG
jgi:hypothetical protein